MINNHPHILSTQLDVAALVCIIPYDCAPVAHLRAKESHLDRIERQKDCTSWFQGPALVGHDPATVALPLLSDYPQLVHFFLPLTAGHTRKAPPLGGPTPKRTKRDDRANASSHAPGSLFHTWIWLAPGKTLLLSNSVWDVTKIATALAITDPLPVGY